MAFFLYGKLIEDTKPADWTGAAECAHCGFLINTPDAGVWHSVRLFADAPIEFETVHRVCVPAVLKTFTVED